MNDGNDDSRPPTPGLADDRAPGPRSSWRPATSEAGRKPRSVLFLYLVALWTLPGLLYSVQIYQLGLRENTPSATFLHSMFHALPVWWFWIPLTPLLDA